MDLDAVIVAAVQRAIADAEAGTMDRWPKRPPNAPLFLLAQHLMSVDTAASMDADSLVPYVELFWESAGAEHSNGTMDTEDAINEFVILWESGRVRAPIENRLEAAIRHAENGARPPAEAEHYTTPGMRKLAHVCYLLARTSDEPGTFYLSGEDAGRIIGKQQRMGSLAMRSLCAGGLLRLLRQGDSLSHRASLYAYIGAPK